MATVTTTKQQISNVQGSCEFKWEAKLVKCLQNCLNPRSIKYIINIIFPFLLLLPEKGHCLPPWFQEALNKVSKTAENMKVTLSEESKRPGPCRVWWQQWGPHLQNTEQDPWQQAPRWGTGELEAGLWVWVLRREPAGKKLCPSSCCFPDIPGLGSMRMERKILPGNESPVKKSKV